MRAREEDISMVILGDITLLYQLHPGNMTREMNSERSNLATVMRLSLERRRRRGGGRPIDLKPWWHYDETGRTPVPPAENPPERRQYERSADNSEIASNRAAWSYYAGCYQRTEPLRWSSRSCCARCSLFSSCPPSYLVRHVFDVVIPRGDLRGVFWDGVAIAACQTLYTVFVALGASLDPANYQDGGQRNPLRSALPPVPAFAKFLQRYRPGRAAQHHRAGHRAGRCDEQCHRLAHASVLAGRRLAVAGADLAQLEVVSGDSAGCAFPCRGQSDFRQKAEYRLPRFPALVRKLQQRRAVCNRIDRSYPQPDRGKSSNSNRQWKHIEDLRETSGRFAWFDTANSSIQGNLAILSGVLVLMVGGVFVAHRSMTIGALLSFFVTLRMLSQYGAQVVADRALRRAGKSGSDRAAPVVVHGIHRTLYRHRSHQFSGRDTA